MNQEFKFPDEKDEKVAISADDDFDLEIEIEDDTPEKDRNKQAIPKEMVDKLDAADDEEELDEKGQALRLKQYKKIYHDERRAKEAAFREQQEAITLAKRVLEENKKLREQYTAGEKTYIETVQNQADLQVQVANVLPPMRAQSIARASGMANVNDKWCEVNFLDFESRLQPHVHILGDAIQGASLMPKSGHMAQAQGLVLARALVATLSQKEVDTHPRLSNFCYSFLDDRLALHLESLHDYDPAAKTYQLVPGSNKPSPPPSTEQAQAAWQWAAQMWQDLLT